MSKFPLLPMLALAFMTPHLRAEPAVVVTLASIGDRIRAQNPDLAAARYRIQEAIGRMNQAGRLTNPELQSGIDQNSNFREGRFEIGISQRFPVTERLKLEKDISLTELQSAEAEVKEVERQLSGQARQAAVKILATRQRRELLGEQSTVLDGLVKFLSDIAAKGEGSPIDASQAKLDAANLAMARRQLDAGEIALTGELKSLLGIRPGKQLVLGGTLPEPALPVSAANPSHRPDFQIAKLDALAAARGVALEQARRYNDVEGGIFAGTEQMEDAPNGLENETTIGLRFKVALPFWNKNEGFIQEAQAKRQRKEMEAAALGRNIQLETDTARAEMNEWAKMITEINGTLLPLANEQAALVETTFHNGQGDIQSVLRSREKRLQLATARLDALREYHIARVRYETALGNH